MAHLASALSREELQTVKAWSASHQEALPAEIQILLARLLALYEGLTKNKTQQKSLLAELNRLMKFSSSSEKGSSEKY